MTVGGFVEQESADLAQRGEVVHVAREVRNVGDRRRSDPLVHALEVRAFELRDLAEVGEILVARRQTRRGRGRVGVAVGGFVPELGRGGAQAGRRFVAEHRMHAVHDQRVDRLSPVLELPGEELRLLERIAAWGGQEHERGVGRGEELLDRKRARGSRPPSLRTRGRRRRRLRSPRIRRPGRPSARRSARPRSRPAGTPASASSTCGRCDCRGVARGGGVRRGSRVRGASAGCRRRSGRSCRARGARATSPSPCTPACHRAHPTRCGRSDCRGCGGPARTLPRSP